MPYDMIPRHQDLRSMTSEHGRRLQDCGFTKLGSPLPWSTRLARTIMSGLIESSSLSETEKVALFSGKHATTTTPTTDGPSTYLTAAQLLASMRSILPDMWDAATVSSSQKTSCQRSRSELRALTHSALWALRYQNNDLPSFFDTGLGVSLHGSTPTGRATTHEGLLANCVHTWDLKSLTSAHQKTARHTACGKLER